MVVWVSSFGCGCLLPLIAFDCGWRLLLLIVLVRLRVVRIYSYYWFWFVMGFIVVHVWLLLFVYFVVAALFDVVGCLGYADLV